MLRHGRRLVALRVLGARLEGGLDFEEERVEAPAVWLEVTVGEPPLGLARAGEDGVVSLDEHAWSVLRTSCFSWIARYCCWSCRCLALVAAYFRMAPFLTTIRIGLLLRKLRIFGFDLVLMGYLMSLELRGVLMGFGLLEVGFEVALRM